MMDTTIQLHLLRQKKLMTRPFLFMASLLLLVNISSPSDAYTIPSFTRTCITKTTQKLVQRSVPVLTFERQDRIMRRIVLCAVEKATGTTDDSPKKKRRRKLSTASTDAPSPSQSGKMASNVELNETEEQGSMLPNQYPKTSIDLAMMNEIARFEFQNTQNDAGIDLLEPQQSTTSAVSGAILLPDIKEARKRKQMEEEVARLQQQQDEQKIKIKRTDKEAFRRLLEQQPFADADESYFEEEQYGAVSALLGERAMPFLSIPLGPLQVGHFIGSLVFVLMAYIDYPGFPLTNLPTPLRECFQGGLGFVYAINAILAILVAVRFAPDRGQPKFLWIMKTFTVGGLAFDQLMQLPTLVEMEKARTVKGSRAIKKKSSTR